MCKFTISTFQFMERFPTDESAREFLEKRRWPNGVECPKCQAKQGISPRKGKRTGYYQCYTCKKEFTVRTGAIYERSHIGLQKWLYTMYLIATARKGVSSLQLSKEIGIKQSSAWFMLHRIREACKNDGEMLSGFVEIDETYIGGKESNKHAHKRIKGNIGGKGKAAVLGMRERGGRVKAMPIPNPTTKVLARAINDNIVRQSVICTDDAGGYRGIGGYMRLSVNHSAKEYVNGMASTNGIESVWALLKRGYYGTYHQFSHKHLARYVNEFAFRLNEGNVRRHTWERIDSLCDMAVGNRITYRELTV